MIADYTLSDYVRLVYKRKSYFYIIVGVTVLIATILSLVLPRVYQTRLRMYAPSSADLMTFTGRRGQGTVLRPLLPTINELMSGAVLGILKSDMMRQLLAERIEGRTSKQLHYVIDYAPDYGHFEVTVSDRRAEKAMEIANAIPDVANEMVVKVSGTTLARNLQYVRSQLDTARAELEGSRERLRRFQEEHIHVILGQQSQMLISRNAENKVEYDRLGLDIERVSASIAAIEEQMSKEAELFVESETVAQDPTIQQLRSALTEKEMRMAGLRAQYTELHPNVVALQKEIDDTRELIRREVERLFSSRSKPSNTIYENLRKSVIQNHVDLASTVARREALGRLIEESNEVLLTLPELQTELANLTFDARVREGVVTGLVGNLTELELQVGRQFQSFIVLESAKQPKSPSFPILWLNVMVAIIFGGIGGVFYCSLLEYWEQSKIARYADAESG